MFKELNFSNDIPMHTLLQGSSRLPTVSIPIIASFSSVGDNDSVEERLLERCNLVPGDFRFFIDSTGITLLRPAIFSCKNITNNKYM